MASWRAVVNGWENSGIRSLSGERGSTSSSVTMSDECVLTCSFTYLKVTMGAHLAGSEAHHQDVEPATLQQETSQ